LRTETTHFDTANLAVAAYLTAGKHLRLLDVDGSDRRRAMFIFEDPQGQGSRLEAGFLTDGALVPGAEFHRQLRVLRRLVEERIAEQQRQFQHTNFKGYEQNEHRVVR